MKRIDILLEENDSEPYNMSWLPDDLCPVCHDGKKECCSCPAVNGPSEQVLRWQRVQALSKCVKVSNKEKA